MAGSQISTSVSIIDSLSGFMALSLTEYNTSAAAAIAAGSKVEIAGAFFQFPSDETPTGWAAIVTATTAYIALTASGTAGSQVVNAGYVSTAPTWRDDLQGWYASAASSVRIVASVYKAEATSYYPKYVLKTRQSDTIKSEPFLSVASSLSVGGVASVASSFSVNGLFYPTGIVPINKIHTNSAVTFSSLYTAIQPYIPTTGQSIIINGTFVYSGYGIVTYAERLSSTQVTLYYHNGTSVQSYILATGGATAFSSVSIAW